MYSILNGSCWFWISMEHACTYCIILIYVKSDRSIIEYFSVLNYKICCLVRKKKLFNCPTNCSTIVQFSQAIWFMIMILENNLPPHPPFSKPTQTHSYLHGYIDRYKLCKFHAANAFARAPFASFLALMFNKFMRFKCILKKLIMFTLQAVWVLRLLVKSQFNSIFVFSNLIWITRKWHIQGLGKGH